MRPKLAACVDAIAGGVEAAHIVDGRRPHTLLARALHRRRHRHEDHRVKSLAELQELEARWVMQTYARAPVEFVRGEGARLWDSEGNEYLDFLAGISVCSVGHCHPAVVEAVREQAGTLTHTSNLYLTEGGVLLASGCAELEPRAAGPSSATRAPRRTSARSSWCESTRTAGASPSRRSSSSREPSTAGRWARSRRRPASPRTRASPPTCRDSVAVPRDDPDALRDAVGEQTAAVMLEPIQGETGVNVIPDELIARRARGLRRGRAPCSSSTRSRPGWAGPDRSGPTSSCRRGRT